MDDLKKLIKIELIYNSVNQFAMGANAARYKATLQLPERWGNIVLCSGHSLEMTNEHVMVFLDDVSEALK